MLHPVFLNISITLVTDNRINYGQLALGESLLTLLGIGLWVVGIDVWQGQSRVRKIGGVLLFLLAAGYSVIWVGINHWAISQLREYFF